MPSKSIKCIDCHGRPKPTKRRKLSGKANASLRDYLSSKTHTSVTESDYVCDNCRQCFYREQHHKRHAICSQDSQDEIDENIDDGPKISPKSITLPILTKGGSHRKCLLCLKKSKNLPCIPAKARTQVLIRSF